MKKKIISILITFVLIFVLASCKNDNVDSLSLNGYSEVLTVGDTFNKDGLSVEAKSGDKVIDVTDKASINCDAVDTSKPGTYAIVVNYNNYQEVFYVTVKEKDNNKTLINLKLDTTSVKKDYLISETYKSDGLKLIATYQNSNGDPDSIEYLTDLTGFNIEVKDNQNQVVSGPFTNVGSYDVVVSQDNVSASYKINVTIGAPSLDVAVNAALENKGLVAGGESNNYDPNTNDYYGRVNTAYEYGPDLLSITYKYNGDNYVENYFLNEKEEIVGVRVNEDFEQIEINPDEDPPAGYDPFAKPLEILKGIDSSYLNGLNYSMFAGKAHYLGPEALLQGLYNLAKENRNYDYQESIIKSTNEFGEEEYIYNFSFGYLAEIQTTTVFYFDVVDVSFTLGEGNFLESLSITDNLYVVSEMKTQFIITPRGEPNSEEFYKPDRILPNGETVDTNNPDDLDGYPSDFPVLTEGYTINDCMARLKSNAGSPSSHYSGHYDINQYAGSRDAVNKYPESEIYVTDYTITDLNGNVIDDLEFTTKIDDDNTSDSAIDLKLTDFNSETARNVDIISFIYNEKNIGNFYYEPTDLVLYYDLDENTIKLRFFKYGRYELDMVSLKTTKHLIIDVDYRDPITFTTQVFQDNTNPNLANFVQKNVVDVYVGDVVYFNVAPDSKGDPEFIPTCSDENAIIEINPINSDLPEKLFDYDGFYSSFTSSVEGTYEITLKSNRNNVSSKLTINVKPEPDFTEKLSSSYTFNVQATGAMISGEISFEIDPEVVGVIGGKAEINVGEFNETISFNYANREFKNVGHISGDKGFNIELSVNENLDIVISGSYRDEKDNTVYSFNSVLTLKEG